MAGRVIASGLTQDRTFAFPDANGTLLYQGVPAATVGVGTGTAVGSVGGTLFTSTTATSTTGLVEETLLSYTLPANTLAVNGRGVRITFSGTTAANANAKTFIVYFGATPIANSAVMAANPNNLTYQMTVTVLRTGAATELTNGVQFFSTSTAATKTTATETLASPVVIKITGTTPTTIGDMTATLLIVEAI